MGERFNFNKMWVNVLLVSMFTSEIKVVLAQDAAKPEGNDNIMLDMVTLPQGQIKGQMLMSRSGRQYFGFMSIPYARVPRKFDLAEPANAWNGVLDATKPAPMCPQMKFGPPAGEPIGQEDCLYLSVHSPKEAMRRRNFGPLFPVMVFIHGGAFMSGAGDEYSGKYLQDEDLVLVTINYRLGALGFLSTGDGEILGNQGLKDQVLALKWVQSYIHFFGGDARRVTLYGQGFGAVSAQLHMLSPMSTGLFTNVIASSGSALNPWAIAKNPGGMAQKFGMKLGCNSTNTRDLALCIKARDVKDIVMAQTQLSMEWHMDPFVPFPPTVEVVSTIMGYIQPQGVTFLPEHPYQMIIQGRYQRVPMITGITKDEGLLVHSETILANAKSLEELNTQWNRVAPITLEYEDVVPFMGPRDHVSQKIKSFYFGNKMIGPETRENLTNLFSDRLFVHGVQTAAFNFARNTAVYPYYFSYKGANSYLKPFGIAEAKGSSHMDDLQYFFEMPEMAVAAGSPDEMISKKLVKLWTSFAYYGKPVEMSAVEWMPIQPEERGGGIPTHYYDLNTEFRPIMTPFLNRMHFWNSLMDTDLRDELVFFPYRNNNTAIQGPMFHPYQPAWG